MLKNFTIRNDEDIYTIHVHCRKKSNLFVRASETGKMSRGLISNFFVADDTVVYIIYFLLNKKKIRVRYYFLH